VAVSGFRFRAHSGFSVPRTFRPVPLGILVDHMRLPMGLPVLRMVPFHPCHRDTPAGLVRSIDVLSRQCRPFSFLGSILASPVSGLISAGSLGRLSRPSTPEASARPLPPTVLRLVQDGPIQFRVGLAPTVVQHIFTALEKCRLTTFRCSGIG
jgi:hypothetical protein